MNVNYINENNYWTNFLGLSRTLLALSTFITLLFNNTTLLFFSGVSNENKPNIDNLSLNVYTWFPSIEYGYWLSIGILFFVIIGVFPRITCFFHWLVTYSYFNLTTIADGGDQIASIVTFLLIPICIFDKRKWHWHRKNYEHNFYENMIANIFHWLIVLQVFIIYFFAAVGKFDVEEWKNGTALYYWFTEPLFGPTNFYMPLIDFILKSSFLSTFLTWLVLLFELTLSFTIFTSNKKIKRKLLIAGILFHFGILIFFGLVSFFLTMTACLILFLNSKNTNYDYNNFNITNPFRYIVNLSSNSTKKN